MADLPPAIACPACGLSLKLPDDFRGGSVRCGNCHLEHDAGGNHKQLAVELAEHAAHLAAHAKAIRREPLKEMSAESRWALTRSVALVRSARQTLEGY